MAALALCAALAGGLLPAAGNGTARAAAKDFATDDAPQILTTDLAQLQDVQSGRMTVNFVILGSVPIRRVTINGKPEPFTPGDTVQITKVFEFATRQTVITVQAEDHDGHVRERNYVVNYAAAPPDRRWSFHGNADLRYEVDDNPTNDVGLPFQTPSYNPKGVIPPAQRPDFRQTAAGSLIATYGGFSIFGGGLRLQYEKQINEGLNASLVYGGIGYRFRLGDTSDFVLNYIFADLGIGTSDYAQLNTLSGAFEFRSQDSTYVRRHLVGLDATAKDFVSKDQVDGAVGVLKWDYLRLNPVTLSTFNAVYQGGNATEGEKLTDYNFLSGDWDWHIRWEVGFRWDLGLGLQVRDYSNDKAPATSQHGPERLDNLVRASTGVGWQWNRLWSAMLNYRHLTDVSNKAPYYRNIYGLTVLGGF